jgi:putative two-component system response regulator
MDRIGLLCELLARGLGLPRREVEMIRHAAPMHDVGKIRIPDAILLKPGPLDPAEWKIMKQHATLGASVLHGATSPVMQLGEQIALAHHERWDGQGYPHGLAGEIIPLAARICCVADVFDGLTNDRAYRGAVSPHTAYEMMEADSGRRFDPRVLRVFLQLRRATEALQRHHRWPERRYVRRNRLLVRYQRVEDAQIPS